jgi:hypothetical protein
MRGPGTPRATPVVSRFPLERLAVTLAGSALAAPLLIVALRALGLSLPAAGIAVAGGLAAAVPGVVRWLPPGLDGAARWRPVMAVIWLTVARAAAFQTARIATVMLDVAAMAVVDDPSRLRPIWFALSALLLGAAYLAAAAWIGGTTGWRMGLLFPLYWLSFPVQAGLQMGNLQLPVVPLSVLAMLAFARQREALGGAMLAFAVAAQLSPAVLLVYLVVRRRWRALAWTAGFGASLGAVTWLGFGAQPFRSFFADLLPRLASSLSPVGLVLLVYLALVVLLAAFTARRHRLSEPDRRSLLLVWLALISLAGFQLPFIPGNHGTLSLIWLVLVVAAGVRRAWLLLPLALVWGLCWLPGFLPTGSAMVVYGVLFQLILMAVCVRQLVVGAPTLQPVRPPRRFLVNV